MKRFAILVLIGCFVYTFFMWGAQTGCSQRGGVFVRTFTGFECIKAEVLP